MTWTIDYKSGLRQDHRGRHYRIVVNSRGRQDLIYVDPDTGAEKARTIPVPEEPTPQPRRKVVTTTAGDGTKIPVRYIPQRLHIIEARYCGENQITKVAYPNGSRLAKMVIDSLRPFMRSPDCGRTWLPLESQHSDYHNQYHIDEEKV